MLALRRRGSRPFHTEQGDRAQLHVRHPDPAFCSGSAPERFFYAYRKESDRILSGICAVYRLHGRVENEMSLLGEMTFAAPGSVELEDYADAGAEHVAVERLRTTASAGGRTARCCGRSSAA